MGLYTVNVNGFGAAFSLNAQMARHGAGLVVVGGVVPHGFVFDHDGGGVFKNGFHPYSQGEIGVAGLGDPYDAFGVGASLFGVVFMGRQHLSVYGGHDGGARLHDGEGHVWTGGHSIVVVVSIQFGEGYAVELKRVTAFGVDHVLSVAVGGAYLHVSGVAVHAYDFS